jgi:hypothetical protein
MLTAYQTQNRFQLALNFLLWLSRARLIPYLNRIASLHVGEENDNHFSLKEKNGVGLL